MNHITEEPLKVWIVTSGSYSAYDWRGIFSTQQKAWDYIAKLKSTGVDDAESEDVDVNAMDTALIEPTYTCILDTGGNVVKQLEGPYRFAEGERRGYASGGYAGAPYSATSFESPEHALKLAVEHRQAWLRNQAALPEVERR